MPVRVGISPFAGTRDGSFAVADVAFEAGVDTFWLGEGLLEVDAFPRWAGGMEPLTWLAYLAGRYPGVRVGLGASVLPLRDVTWLAKQAATLDHLTEGNFVLAVAPGFWEREFVFRGESFEHRGSLFDERLGGLLAAFAGEEYHAPGLDLPAGGRLSPAPFDDRSPRLWFAGGPATLRKARRRGVPFQARAAAPEELAPVVADWKAGGGGLFALRLAVEVTDTPSTAAHVSGYRLSGTAEHVAATLAEYVRLGVDDLSLIPGSDDESSLATTRALAGEVLPRLRDLVPGAPERIVTD